MNHSVIIEGKIINADDEFYGQIEINTKTGLIEKVANHIGSPTLIASQSQLIFPGFIDPHVHAREDASGLLMYKEDYITASAAAINGGVVFIADMPNTPQPPIDDTSYFTKKGLSDKSEIDILIYAAIGINTKPLDINVPYKLFMTSSFDGISFTTESEIEEAVGRYSGKTIAYHGEHPNILREYKDAPTHEERRPNIVEYEAAKLAITLSKKYQIRTRFVHCSTAESAKIIDNARTQGVQIISEITPHHLFFDWTMLTDSNRPFLRINPPIRSRENRLEMIELLKQKKIDCIGTDHSPHTVEEKLNGTPGIPHLDTYSGIVTWLMHKQGFSPQRICEICCYNPSIFTNEFTFEKYGKISPGYVGSLTILDTNLPWRVTKQNIKTKVGWSPYEGIIFPGRAKYTVIRGKIFDSASVSAVC